MPLHPSAQVFLEELASAESPSWSELPPAQSREIFNSFNDLFGDRPAVAEVRELRTPDNIPLRLYRPVDVSVLPAIVYFHGGGWVLGNLETHDALCRRLAIASHRAVVAVDYRLAPEHPYPAAFEDCFSATEYVITHSGQLGIDPQHIALAGDSAGGNLVAAVSLRARDARLSNIDSQVMLYPVVSPDFETESYRNFGTDYMLTRDSMEWFWKQYLGGLDSEKIAGARYASLLDHDLNDLPATLLLTAEYDVLRSEGEAFAKRLLEAGNDLTTAQWDGMLHGFIHFSGRFEEGRRAIAYVGAYLQARLG